ncbi:hypothetical protein DR96_3987 (plasmid) [Providencia stuartii]|nr:hypothetical protein DR96_3987 [Providencia stuartii]
MMRVTVNKIKQKIKVFKYLSECHFNLDLKYTQSIKLKTTTRVVIKTINMTILLFYFDNFI